MASEAVCIATRGVERVVFPDLCSMEDRMGSWQHLEQFWGDERQRLRDCDGQEARKLSSSLEEQLLFDDCINDPSPAYCEEKIEQSVELTPVFGKDIKDIPTTYRVGGFESHELIVIGTYVDSRILPGFRYKVRKNGTQHYLFNGRALTLETVGQGYGKRLTFRGDKLNDNSNFFWSDSREGGYALTPQSIESDSVFEILDSTTGQQRGRVLVNEPATTPEEDLETRVGPGGRVQKKVRVHFGCDVVLKNASDYQNVFVRDMVIKGEAEVVRESASSVAKVTRIDLDDFVVDGCHLVPE